MSRFKVTKEELKEAKKSGFFELTDGRTYKFIVNEVEEKDDDNILVKTTILACEQDSEAEGMNYNIFYGNSDFAQAEFIRFMQLFFTEEVLMEGILPTQLISCVFTGTAKGTSSKKDPTKIFMNLRKLEACGSGSTSDVPDFSEEETEVEVPTKTDAELLKEAKADQAKEDVEDFGKTKSDTGLF